MSLVKKFKLEGTNNFYSRKTLFFCLLGVFLLILIQIWVAHTTNTSGERLKEIEQLQKILKTENQIINNEIAYLSSVYRIATEAASLGFESPTNIKYIK